MERLPTEVRGAVRLYDYDASLSPELRAGWDGLLKIPNEQPSFLQCPEYFDHLATTQHKDNIYLATMGCGETELVGLVPVRKMPTVLDFCAGHKRFALARFQGLHVLGGNVRWPTSDQLHVRLMDELVMQFPEVDVIQISGVRTDSPIWALLTKCPEIAEKFHVYVPHGVRQCLTTPIPNQLGEYLGKIGAKKRYNLNRQLKQFAGYSQDHLELKRIESARDVVHLHEPIVKWQFATGASTRMSYHELTDLADRDLLLSYVLMSRNRTCAFAFGHRYRNTLFVHKIWHDRTLDAFSPGATLHHLMMQDIITHQLARCVDYGFGMPRYGAASTNLVDERATVLLFKKRLSNRSIILLHSQFHRAIEGAKHLIHRSGR